MMNSKSLILLAGIAAILFAAWWAFYDRVPPRALTSARMYSVELRAREYWRRQGTAPATLADLPVLEGRMTSVDDGWRRPLDYTVSGSIVSVTSLGADGQPGGTDQDADMLHTFDLAR